MTPLDPTIIPKDSLLVDWMELLSIAETPLSYQLLTGMAAIGVSLRRSVYVDQFNWRIFPNISILLVGPSGIGKDTAINEAEKFLKTTGIPRVYGRTIEEMFRQMLECGDPAACYIPAPEVSSFCGPKDYQAGIISELTDVLSTKDQHDISTKSLGKQSIMRPTVSLFAGSTEEWLHKSMPDGSLEGGWWPRFVIACEEYGSKFVPLLAYVPIEERVKTAKAKAKFYNGANALISEYYAKEKEVIILADARDYYCDWYINRHKFFSKTVRPYAERSRDQVIRLALIMALSRGHGFIDVVDMQFADKLMLYVAQRIDHAVQPPNRLSRIAKAIIPILPASDKKILKELSRQFDPMDLERATKMMAGRGEIAQDKERKNWVKVEDWK